MVDNEIDINLCRGQSYDNASNMSGPCSGMQAIIKAKNPFADFIPCTAHSLNLVGQSTVDCCVKTVSFFGFVQELYNFFSASKSRWSILKKSLDSKCQVPKSIAKTRWSANAESINALSIGYKDIFIQLWNI
uniref:Zinc finger MYM-type protein 1 n=1 Tax=Sipha flava TaxID=143950 RepID=A0A2S2RAD6_9HEMI